MRDGTTWRRRRAADRAAVERRFLGSMAWVRREVTWDGERRGNETGRKAPRGHVHRSPKGVPPTQQAAARGERLSKLERGLFGFEILRGTGTSI